VQTQPSSPPIPSLDPAGRTLRRLRNRGWANLARMGHCAPSITQAVLDVAGVDGSWLVKLAAGLPGGIGNTGGECGGVTAPLMLLGVRDGLRANGRALPMIVYEGHDLLRRFTTAHGTTSCEVIRGKQRVPVRCIGVVGRSPGLCAQTACSDCAGSLSREQEAAYARLHAHWTAERFHCAHAVLLGLDPPFQATRALLDAAAGFMGGTVFAGLTCSVLVAGVMALGLARGEIEKSMPRVLRMIGTMAVGGDAFADRINAFNRTMNRGNRLARRFAHEHGGVLCRGITGCDFATDEGVQRYIEDGGTARCRALARSVARRIQGMS
jgi:C_GCAxxG_C_C family probable redox protein